MNVTEFYQEALTRRGFQADAAQNAAVERLQQLYDALLALKQARSNAFKKMIDRSQAPRGVYLWAALVGAKVF